MVPTLTRCPSNRQQLTALNEKIATAIRTRSSFSYRTHARNPDAEAQIVDTVGEVELGEDGRVIAVVGVCNDVTAQVIAEAEREAAQKRYRLMAEEASDIIALHENDRIVCVSSALERLLGRTPEELQRGRYLELVHPDDVEEAKKLLGRPPPGETRIGAYRVRHADGHYVWLETSGRGVYDESTGAFLHEIAVARDISERKEQELKMRAAQERAEAANKAKSLFLANMSHELRTPLNAIMGFADMMRQRVFGPLGDARYEAYSAEIHNSARLLLEHISDVLEIANVEAGMFELSCERLDLGELVHHCIREHSGLAREKSLTIAVEGERAGVELTADRHALRQIIDNLLSNAVKFTAPGGHIAVELSDDSGVVRLVVRDDGVGIPASELPRLGRPFEQVCAERYLAKNGQGLGLALVSALVQKHGGTLQIESAEGEGTTVSIELPTEPVRAAA